ncbi:sterol desaturase family protein [Porticoccaceae bacterium]|nr:sterol desaturase family protein [Porticoccaceae bacterium]MDB2635432.1 sterol desaturase family protein [Porticoccaceae bacterium]MDB2664283.1 sterol desaturase family protein [Porticoccaceae bacterium]
MNFVPYAVPFFLLLIVFELAWGWWRGNNTYRVNDSLNSLSLGLLSTVTKLVFLNVGLLVFSQVEQHYAIWAFDVASYSHWLLALLLYDFLYYWFHRISHERQFFWGSHVVHHQSEDYNLSTALRQTSTSFATTWVFFVPCFLLGMPIYMYVSVASAHLVYQFWVHTQHIGKLGLFEWFMVTPSNHRVHHAQNADYIDKNYGGLLIVWDRLFGTFKEEDENQTPIYGIRTPLRSWNPLWANVHVFANMAEDAWHTKRWRDKLSVLWARTGWRPADVEQWQPREKSDLADFDKYDPKLPWRANIAVLAQYFLLAFFHLWTAQQAILLSYELVSMLVVVQVFTVLSIGAVLDGSAFARPLEITRLLLLALMLVASYSTAVINTHWFYVGGGLLLLSGLLMFVSVGNRDSSQVSVSPVA